MKNNSHKIHKLYFLLIICFLSACTFNHVDINRHEDIQEGKQFLIGFYKNVKNERFDSLDLIASDTLKKVIGLNGISKIATTVNDKLGRFKEFTISDSYTQRLVGSSNETLYKYKLKIAYEKGIIDEVVGLKKDKKAVIQVISYNVYSNLLK